MIEQVPPAALAAWFAQGASAAGVLLDVRTAAELRFAQVGLDGVVLHHIPMQELPARLEELDPAARIACLCHHGVRSQQAALLLHGAGFAQVANVVGGIDAWSRTLDARVPRY